MKRIVCGTVLALLVVAGAGGPAAAASPRETVATALQQVLAARSLSLTETGRLHSKEDSFSFRAHGIVSLSGSPISDVTFLVDPDGRTKPQKSRTITIGADVWSTWPAGFSNPTGRAWVHAKNVVGDDDDYALAFRLLATARQVRRVSRATIHQRPATRYRVVIDYRRIARNGPKELRKEARAMLKGNPKGLERDDVWIDDAGQLRRVHFVQRDHVATAKVTIDLLQLDVPLDGITPPPADQVAEGSDILGER